jgi:hypothetical protein
LEIHPEYESEVKEFRGKSGIAGKHYSPKIIELIKS